MGACKTALKAACNFARKHCHISKPVFTRKAASKNSPAASKASSTGEVEVQSNEDASDPTLTLDDEMTAIIKHNFSQNRDMELEQAQTSGSITAIDRKMEKLRHRMGQLSNKIAFAPSSGPAPSDGGWVERELEKVRDQLIELQKEKESLNEYLDEVKQCQLEVLRSVFAEMDSYCIEEGFMGEIEPNPMEVYSRLADEANNSRAATPELISATTTPNAPNKAERDLPHAASSICSHPPSVPPERAASPYAMPVVDPGDILRGDYKTAKACLRGVEEDFELREGQFEQARAKYAAEAGNDDSSTARLEIDLEELLETRRLAQALMKAEDWLLEAKEACLAAGVDIAASDLSSGFLDDVNDGYRISEEKELFETVDPAGVMSWLDRIPDDNQGVFEFGDEGGLDIDDWDAQSVEIEDSASMVAEGASRRRIDKWRAMCQEVTATDDSMGLCSMGI